MVKQEHFLVTSKNEVWQNSSVHNDSLFRAPSGSGGSAKNARLPFLSYCPCY